ncbi:uncharacterized protein LOC106646538, partial [Copidosoma floridanum]|uniref:uncharacterized protein LOC106646538 n=2 Tax=Copidosoma floridanum TaxID=29053 RepID=UPI0006C9DE4E
MAADSCSISKDKVWVDKSSYDKAECLYQEKLGKDVLPQKPLTGDDSPLGVTNSTKKSKKSTNKQNSITTSNNDSNNSETIKSSKKKNKKKEAKVAEPLLDTVAIKIEESEISQGSVNETPTTSNKKLKAKEAKEEKNKADKKQKNSDQDKPAIVIQENKGQETNQGGQFSAGSLASEVAKARAHIKQSLQCMDGIAALAGLDSDFSTRVVTIEKQNQDLRN